MGEAVLSRNDRVFLFLALAIAFVTMFTLTTARASRAAAAEPAASVFQPLQLARVHAIASHSVRAVSAF